MDESSDYAELCERLTKAAHTLESLARHSPSKEEKPHLRSKAEGVRLALSYVREMAR